MARQHTAPSRSPSADDNTVLSVRLDPRLRQRLGRLAKASDRTSSWLVQDALAAYLDAQEWQVEAVGEAVRQADEHPERGVANARVRAWVESWAAKSLSRIA